MRFLYLLAITSLLASCDFPEHFFSEPTICVSDKAFADLGAFNSEVYQQKVRAVLKEKSSKDFRYIFQTFIEEGNTSYMMTSFRNDTSCFTAKIVVDKWDKLAGMKRTNGRSYPPELYDLEWELTNINGKEEIRYLNMHHILD